MSKGLRKAEDGEKSCPAIKATSGEVCNMYVSKEDITFCPIHRKLEGFSEKRLAVVYFEQRIKREEAAKLKGEKTAKREAKRRILNIVDSKDKGLYFALLNTVGAHLENAVGQMKTTVTYLNGCITKYPEEVKTEWSDGVSIEEQINNVIVILQKTQKNTQILRDKIEGFAKKALGKK